jgi:hypothetical protein
MKTKTFIFKRDYNLNFYCIPKELSEAFNEDIYDLDWEDILEKYNRYLVIDDAEIDILTDDIENPENI